jgi:hypothetical protein
MILYLKAKGKYPSIDHLDSETMYRLLNSKVFEHVGFETNNPLLIDQVEINGAMDWHLKFGDLNLKDADVRELMTVYEVGIESISEILRNRGVWKA